MNKKLEDIIDTFDNEQRMLFFHLVGWCFYNHSLHYIVSDYVCKNKIPSNVLDIYAWKPIIDSFTKEQRRILITLCYRASSYNHLPAIGRMFTDWFGGEEFDE